MERRGGILVAALIILPLIFGYYFYQQFPDQFAIHWNLSGQADGYASRTQGIIILPVISAFIAGLFLFLPRIDPLRKNYESFKKYYDGLIIVMIGFFTYLQILMLLWNLSYPFNFTQAISFGFGILFYYLGVLVENAKQNWFVGIRTPWTLSSTRVWDKTHKLGGKLFKAVGIISFVSAFIFSQALLISVALVLVAAITSVVYSYIEFRKS